MVDAIKAQAEALAQIFGPPAEVTDEDYALLAELGITFEEEKPMRTQTIEITYRNDDEGRIEGVEDELDDVLRNAEVDGTVWSWKTDGAAVGPKALELVRRLLAFNAKRELLSVLLDWQGEFATGTEEQALSDAAEVSELESILIEMGRLTA